MVTGSMLWLYQLEALLRQAPRCPGTFGMEHRFRVPAPGRAHINLLSINRLLPASGRQPYLRWFAMNGRRRLAGAGLEGNQAGRSNLRKARASPAPIAVDRPGGSDRYGASPRLRLPAQGKPIRQLHVFSKIYMRLPWYQSPCTRSLLIDTLP